MQFSHENIMNCSINPYKPALRMAMVRQLGRWHPSRPPSLWKRIHRTECRWAGKSASPQDRQFNEAVEIIWKKTRNYNHMMIYDP